MQTNKVYVNQRKLLVDDDDDDDSCESDGKGKLVIQHTQLNAIKSENKVSSNGKNTTIITTNECNNANKPQLLLLLDDED